MKNGYIKIAPSILSADFCRLGEQVAEVAKAGADYIHVDVMDGHFVPNITVGVPIVKALHRCSKLPLDVHLMISNPSEFIEQFVEAGASIITVHIECEPHLNRLIQTIKKFDIKAGVALNPATSLTSVEEVVGLVDQILIMSVNPGFGGQELLPGMIDKIKRTRDMLNEKHISAELEVDGGINLENAPKVVEAGADIIVAGNAIFSGQNATAALNKMRRVIT